MPRYWRVRHLQGDTFWQVSSVGLIAVVWEITGRLTNPLIFPPLSRVISAWFEIILTGELVKGLALSISALLLGLSFALIIGISTGVAMGWFRQVEYLVD